MLNYIIKRLLFIIPTLLGILTITFAVIQFVPGGPVDQMVWNLTSNPQAGEGGQGGGGQKSIQNKEGRRISPEDMQKLKEFYGFDKPVLQRYFEMLANYSRFELGESFFYQKKVGDLIIEKLPVSISLGLWTFFLSYLICIPLGIYKAVREGTRFDAITSVMILVGYAIPSFVLGVLLLVLFGGGTFFAWFPLGGLTSDNWEELTFWGKVGDYLWHIALPVTSSVAGSLAVMTILTKNIFLEEIRRQYVYTARAKGISEKRILFGHILKNGAIPLVTGLPGAFIGAFFTGSLLIETLFSLNGLGLLSYESVIKRDYPVVMGTLFVFTLIGLVTKLISDLCYVLVDPRVHFDKGGN